LKHFRKHYLHSNEILIDSKVNEILKLKKIEKENDLKQSIKEEILATEKRKLEDDRMRELKMQARKELIEEGILTESNKSDSNKREQIAQDVLDKVWNRDGGKCVICGSQEKIEFDHIIPFSKGGANTYRNIQILCEKCNRAKSNKIG
jgi:hypothetical protein